MYIFNTPPMVYSDPWLTDVNIRVASLSSNDKHVIYYYDFPDNSTFRYRVHNMMQVINKKIPGTSATYFSALEIDILERSLAKCNVLVICRAKYTDKLNRIITKAKNKGIPVFFDLDDLVFEPKYIHLLLDTLDQDLEHPNVWDFWFAYVGRIRASLDLCDRVITTNQYLANMIQTHTHKPVSVIENFLNQEQVEYSQRIFAIKQRQGFARDENILLGYFSGTPSHNKDLHIVSDALVELFEKDPRVTLRIVGFIDLKDDLNCFSNRIEKLPLTNYLDLQRLIGEVEINLVPLQENEFTNCKSELKYFEAGVVGTTSIASPTYTYRNAITHKANGFIAAADQWISTLKEVINSIDDISELLANSYQASMDRYAWYNYSEKIMKIID